MRILIIEDEEVVAHPLQRGLKSFLYSVDVATTGKVIAAPMEVYAAILFALCGAGFMLLGFSRKEEIL